MTPVGHPVADRVGRAYAAAAKAVTSITFACAAAPVRQPLGHEPKLLAAGNHGHVQRHDGKRHTYRLSPIRLPDRAENSFPDLGAQQPQPAAPDRACRARSRGDGDAGHERERHAEVGGRPRARAHYRPDAQGGDPRSDLVQVRLSDRASRNQGRPRGRPRSIGRS